MLRFKVLSVTKKLDGLTYVVVEPCKESPEDSFLLENSIRPGCIQHIIQALKKNEFDKDECDRLCGILYSVYMDGDTSRKMISFQPLLNNSNYKFASRQQGDV